MELEAPESLYLLLYLGCSYLVTLNKVGMKVYSKFVMEILICILLDCTVRCTSGV